MFQFVTQLLTHFLTLRQLAIFSLCLISSPQAFAAFQLSHEVSGLPILGEASVIEDPSRQLTIDDILDIDKTEFQQQ